MKQNKKIILASSSSYRQQLLSKINLKFTAVAPEIDESAKVKESAQQQALRLAQTKALALQQRFEDHLIIGSDQVAYFDGLQLEKPGDRSRSIQQLKMIEGKTVNFYTAICVLDSQSKKTRMEIDCCAVTFRTLTLPEIENYVDLDKPYHCAGSFKSEGLGIALIKKIDGDDPNSLIGLPIIKLIDLLTEFGIKILD
jgi:MAF protein